MKNRSIEVAVQLFSENSGILRTSQALSLGIAPRTLYMMRDSGLLRQISRGTFQLADQDLLGNPDLVSVAKRVQKGVICLISALHYYELTTEIPHKVYVALPQSAEKPRMEFPPLELFWLSDKSYFAGITEQTIDGVTIKIYSLEKTIADCFKFRNKIGNDVALEALKDYLKKPTRNIDQLITFAKIDRVEALVSRYLEALL